MAGLRSIIISESTDGSRQSAWDASSDLGPFETDAQWAITDLTRDRGDAPARAVIDRNQRAQANRRAEETKYELNKINARVEQTVAAFELSHHFQEDDKSAFFVPDLVELEKVVGDAIQKRKYQQHVMIFIVGFEEATEQKLKLLNQINDFFTVYINSIDEKQLEPQVTEVDLEQVSTSVQEALATADQATQKLSEINHEIVSYVERLHNGKALTKRKRKLEKALSQAKEDIMGLAEKLMGAQAEIEDKEDQMTKLYKQIDIKNVETMKHKTAAENAKKKLAEIDDLKSTIKQRDEEIDRLNKVLFEHELSVQQMAQSRELSYTKLKGTQKDSEENIQKLQSKVQNLQLLLEDTKADLQKHHKIQLSELKQEHQEELDNTKKELQQRIDQLESDALNQKKDWASDSDEETYISSKPGSRQVPSRKSVKNAPSRQSTQVSLEKSMKPAPETPKNNSMKDVSDSSTPSTPKRPAHKKTGLDPVHEVAYEGPVNLDDEEKWKVIPREVMPSAFKQYRKEAILVVKGLQTELKTKEADHMEKVTKMTKHIKETEETFQKEKSDLLKQVDASLSLKEAAEKEADKALAQLETFVAEHGELVKKLAEPATKELKKLTPEQREKYIGKETKEPKEEKKNVKGKKITKKPNQRIQRGKSMPPPQDGPPEKTAETNEPKEEKVGSDDIKDNKSDARGLAAADDEVTLLDAPGKQSVERGQQTSQPESEAHQSLLDRLLSMGKMKPAPARLALSSSSENPEDSSSDESSASARDLQGHTESVVRKPLLDPLTYRSIKHKPHKTIVSHKSVQCSLPVVGKLKRGIMLADSDNSNNINGSHIGVLANGADNVDGMSSSKIEGSGGDYFVENDNDTDMVEKEAMARHLRRILDSSQWSNGEEQDGETVEEDNGEPNHERPSSALSQRSLYEKFKAQLEQTKQEIIERRSQTTSMHGTLLSGHSSRVSSRVGSAVTAASGDMELPDEEKTKVTTTDIGTSPFLLTPESGNSRKSSICASDHPIVLNYLRTYDIIKDFARSISQAFADKGVIPASERLRELKSVELNNQEDRTAQLSGMTSSLQLFLDEISAVLVDYLNQEPEADVSSLVTSRLNTGRSYLTTAPSVGLQTGLSGRLLDAPLPRTPRDPGQTTPDDTHSTKNSKVSVESSVEYRQLKEEYDRLLEDSNRIQDDSEKLREDISIQKQTYEGKLKDSTLHIADLEETIRQLQHELARLEMTPSTKLHPSAIRAPSGTFTEVPSEPLVVFSRTDTERNQRVLKRGINSNKVSRDQYNEAVRAMERYNAVPAKRLIHIVKKYTHHTHMKHIEGNIKKSNAIDDEVYSLLQKMEALQNKRTEKWGEQMDQLADERRKLAQQLMEKLTRLEEESGIFLIKPILSWRGRGFLPHYESKQSTYKPPKTYLRPFTIEGSIVFGPAPTPTPSHANRRVNHVEADDRKASPVYHQSSKSVHGSAVHLVGTPPQGMWSMSSSLPAGDSHLGDGDRMNNKLSSPLITTPKILELEVNRMMIGQNTVSAPTKAFLSEDRLVNAANHSVRSYVTVARPSAHPMPTVQPQRPYSTGTEYTRISTALPVSRSPGLHVRAKSESALNISQPLPPIKVPTEEGKDAILHVHGKVPMTTSADIVSPVVMGNGTAVPSCVGDGEGSPASPMLSDDDIMSPGKCSNTDVKDAVKPVLHPSPPHTPPGSSLLHSPVNGALSVDELHPVKTAGPGANNILGEILMID